MFLPFILFIAFSSITITPIFPGVSARYEKSKNITVKDFQKPISRQDAVHLLGLKNILDSNETIEPNTAIEWHERMLDSIRKKAHKKNPRFSAMSFRNIRFEGSMAKVTVLLGDDSSFGTIVAIPYPLKIGTEATSKEFNRLRENIVKTLGEPTVSTTNYIDYLTNGQQTVFGEFKEGKISIVIWNQES